MQRQPKLKQALGFFFATSVCILVVLRFGLLPGVLVWFVFMSVGCFRILGVFFSFLLGSRGSASLYRDALRRADTMEAPITEKQLESNENEHLLFSYGAMQGWRRAMEDAHSAVLEPSGGFFAIFDGHCGSSVAAYCGQHLREVILDTSPLKGKDFSKATFLERSDAMVAGFVGIDRQLFSHPVYRLDKSGCTAVALWIVGDDLLCANAGDSRCVLCRSGQAVPLSNDHKPNLPEEQQRIQRARGFVWNRRVNGVLALSRAIGDWSFKGNSQIDWEDQAVTPVPEVTHTVLNYDTDTFAVLACDGIWDVMSNTEVVNFVSRAIEKSLPTHKICEMLMDQCLSTHPFGLGCDNMSCIIVVFKKPHN